MYNIMNNIDYSMKHTSVLKLKSLDETFCCNNYNNIDIVIKYLEWVWVPFLSIN